MLLVPHIASPEEGFAECKKPLAERRPLLSDEQAAKFGEYIGRRDAELIRNGDNMVNTSASMSCDMPGIGVKSFNTQYNAEGQNTVHYRAIQNEDGNVTFDKIDLGQNTPSVRDDKLGHACSVVKSGLSNVTADFVHLDQKEYLMLRPKTSPNGAKLYNEAYCQEVKSR